MWIMWKNLKMLCSSNFLKHFLSTPNIEKSVCKKWCLSIQIIQHNRNAQKTLN